MLIAVNSQPQNSAPPIHATLQAILHAAAVTFAISGFFAPPLRVSAKKISPLSVMPFAFCVEVPAPLIPDLSASVGLRRFSHFKIRLG